MRRIAFVPLLAAVATGAFAHPGHGVVQEWHWHATDAFGFVLLLVLAALAIWWFGRK